MRYAHSAIDPGGWLFKHRSHTPLLLIPLIALAMDGCYHPRGSHAWDLAFEFACFGVALAGLAIRAKTIGHIPPGTSGRNTCRQEASQLNTSGMYSIVRNPLYLGNYFVLLGLALMTQSPLVVALGTCLFALAYGPIIRCEEAFLAGKFGQSYAAYAAAVPRFWPHPQHWRNPALPFSLRMLLRREHDSWMSALAAFVLLEHARMAAITDRIAMDPAWDSLGLAGLLLWGLLKLLKKRSPLLRERTDIPIHSHQESSP